VAHTIANLRQSECIKAQHLAEAVQYRPRWESWRIKRQPESEEEDE
jgi:predicted ATPase with chaperone activity